ncbi:hypothetical protein CHU_2340 [Sporocytophaga myxococcoides]|uniref:TraB/GumN family protein n=1 Tax=Sporocytophaga myxococcoides TaxID=153721 RepID=A0A098LBC9_9BACT|nr:hypothetical protein CHU_2340 [Sporocytophaga myxococcoides]
MYVSKFIFAIITFVNLSGIMFRKIRTTLFLLLVCLSGILKAQSSLLWEVKSPDNKNVSYIYGTMHVEDERVFDFGDSLMICFNKCKAFAGEIVLDKINKSELASQIFMPGDTTLKMLIGKKKYKQVKRKARKSLGVFAGLINRVKPVFTASLISESSFKKGKGKILDEYFQDLAKEKQMVLLGIESPSEQIAALDEIPLAEQAQMLIESLEAPAEEEGADELVKIYNTGDLDSLYNHFLKFDLSDNFTRSLLTKRNYVMSERIQDIINEYPVFVGIGAAHLPGEEGVLNLMVKQGYMVRPVQIKTNKNKK